MQAITRALISQLSDTLGEAEMKTLVRKWIGDVSWQECCGDTSLMRKLFTECQHHLRTLRDMGELK